MLATEVPGVVGSDASEARLARLYRATTEIRDGIARAGDAGGMLAIACRVAVDVAGYRLAYAGLLDEATPDRRFAVVASAGDDIGWVAGVRAALDPDSPDGRTIGARALQGGATVVVDDLAALPAADHRQEAVDRHGLRSLVLLPLRVRDRPVGGMAVYAMRPGAFGTAEVSLLERVMGEISFELERLERDAALRESEERYRMLVQSASDAMLVAGLDGRFVDANEAAVRMTGYPREELWAMGPQDLAAPDGDAVADLRRLAVGEVMLAERPIVARDGRRVWVELTATRLPDGRLQALLRDISARREAEQRADRLLHLYRATADIDRAIRAMEDPDELFREACRIAVEVGGFRLAWVGELEEARPGRPVRVVAAAGEAMGFLATTPSRAFVDPPDGGPRLKGLEAILRDQPIVMDIGDSDDPETARAFGLLSAALVPFHIGPRVVAGFAVYAADAGAFGPAETGLIGRIAEDVSFRLEAIERERARRTLEAERDRLALAVEQASEAVFIAEAADGRLIYVNRQFEAMSGHQAADLLGRPVRELMEAAENGPQILAEIRARLAAGQGWSGEIGSSGPDGGRRLAAVSMTPLRDATGDVTHLVAIMRDVTAQRELEEQLRQAQKMDAVGRLAGGVAHDFNNLLTAIMGYASLARVDVSGMPVEEDIAAIERTAERAADLTRQLLAFARQSPLVRTVFAPDELVAEVAPLLRRLIGEDIELQIGSPGAAGRVVGDENQLQQALINLVVNARDAMPDGGTIRIATADVDLDDAFVALHPDATPGRHIRIEVQDSGTGIPAGIAERVFDPFFTTKEQGRGTGLGLSMVLGTVQAAGGCITVDSEPGRGTRFRVYLPGTDEEPTAPAGPAVRATVGIGRGRTALVVEDEDVVRAFAVRVLAQEGFRILEARGGEEAVALVAGHDGDLDVVVADVVMPGLDGPATLDRIRALRPGVPALFVTGYASRSTPSARLPGTALLPKPYRQQALVDGLAALLGRAGGPGTRA